MLKVKNSYKESVFIMANFSSLNKENFYLLGEDVTFYGGEIFLQLESVEKHLRELVIKTQRLLNGEQSRCRCSQFAEIAEDYLRFSNFDKNQIRGGVFKDENSNELQIGILYYTVHCEGSDSSYFIPVENLSIVNVIEVEIELRKVINDKILELQNQIKLLQP